MVIFGLFSYFMYRRVEFKEYREGGLPLGHMERPQAICGASGEATYAETEDTERGMFDHDLPFN